MNRPALVGLVGLLVVLASSTVVRATAPPDEVPTDFVRRLAEVEAAAYFVATDPGVTNVACAPPTVDAAGGVMTCYGSAPNGAPVSAIATINDDGGIDITPPAGGSTPPAGGPTAPTVAPTSAPSPTPGSLQGMGSAVLVVDPITAPTIVRVTHDGSDVFSVQPQQGGVAAGNSLLEVTGAWTGRYLVGLGGTISGMAVTADGNWTIEIQSIDSAIALTPAGTVAGEEPEVIRASDTEAVPITVDFTGSGPIVVVAVTSSGSQVLVDEPAGFSGEVTLPPGPGYVTIDATGPWTIAYAETVAATTSIAATTTVAGTTSSAITTTSAA